MYLRLREGCDETFRRILAKYEDDMVCEAGCDACCTLFSVTHVEGRIISDYLPSHPADLPGDGETGCVFLREGRCIVYPVRPIICRTHGLLLFDSVENVIERSCGKNFRGTGNGSFDPEDALDMRRVTESLAVLNVRYCQLAGGGTEDGRVALKALADRGGAGVRPIVPNSKR